MANKVKLIECPACGNTISEKAINCPHCGHRANKTKTDEAVDVLVWGGLILLIGSFIIGAFAL